MHKNILLICLSLFCLPAFAQKHQINFTTLTAQDGLSSNTVNAILKDRMGQLWFATEEGLNKYDGTEFKVYRYKDNDRTSLQSKEVVALHEDKAGRLWIGTMGGSLHCYNNNTDKFIHYNTGKTNKTISNNNVKSICSDYTGKIWIATLAGLNVLDPKTQKFTRFNSDLVKPGAIHTESISSVFADSKRRMWVGTNKGLYLFNRKNNQFIPFFHSASNPQSLVSDTINTIAEDKRGQLWVGTVNGLSMLLPDGNSFKNFKYNAANPESISGNLIYAVAADDRNHIWLGTEGGLDIMDINTGKVARHQPDGRNKFSLTSKSVRSILIDKQGIYWIGTYEGGINKYDKNLTLFNLKQKNEYDPFGLSASFVTAFAETPTGDVFIGTDGGGLDLYHPQTGLFSPVSIQSKNKNSSSGLPILTIALDRFQQLWVGTFRHGLFLYNTQTGKSKQFEQGNGPLQINDDDIFCLKEDTKGKMWVGTNGNGVNVYDPATKTFKKYVKTPQSKADASLPLNGFIRAIEEDRDGNIWIGSYGTGVAVFNPATQKFITFDKQHSKIPSDKILSILADSKGRIWMGTSGDGLALYDRKANRFTTFTEKDGLPNGVIHKVLEDQAGNIWISTNKGISSFNLGDRKFRNYSRYNGLQNNAFMNGAGIRSSNGQLYFGGVDGFNYFDPLSIRENKNIPAIIFNSLKVDNQPVVPANGAPINQHIAVAKEIHINYRQNLSIGFAALNYTTPQQNQYAYQLKGFDKDWIYTGTSHIAYYTNLDPGQYTFQVKARNNDGIWNVKGRQITLVVHPPFWMTIYAYLFYAAMAIGIVLYLRHRGIKKLQRKFELEQEKLRVKQQLEQEQRETERLHELDRMKIKFLTNLSHEFRTPISLIMAPADKLLAQQKDEGTSNQLKLIKRNARRLLNLVNQLLDFRKMEQQELKLNAAEGEIVSIIKEATESFQDLAEKDKITLNFNSEIKRLYACFDHDKIERILFNVLSNSFKFTSAGGYVNVNLGYAPPHADDTNTWISIKVSDNGIGIPKEQQDRIFERFFQINSAPSILNQSSGIGLSITKEFVQMHGGEIYVDSEPGTGTTMTINIPVVPATIFSTDEHVTDITSEKLQDSNVVLKSPRVKPSAPGLLTVLLVEDNDDFRFYLKDNLSAYYKVIEATNGKDGWQKALSCHPALIVSDISMPVMDGIELIRKIKADKRTSNIPVILLTALARQEEQLQGLVAGASDYLTKPFSFEILNARIKNLLELNRILKDTYTKQIKVSASEVKIESSNEKFLGKAVLYIEENINNPQLSVEDLSNHLGMSRGALYYKLLELTEQSPVEFIRSIKLARAAALLERSDLTIAQISYMAGFATPHYFAKSFKAKFGMLPSEYMNQKRTVVKSPV